MGVVGGVDPDDKSVLSEPGLLMCCTYKNKMSIWIQLGSNVISHVDLDKVEVYIKP
jgi:hypothetical protein